MHLLGLAPEGWLASPDNRAGARLGQAPFKQARILRSIAPCSRGANERLKSEG
jgi:hypothetical protein